MDILRYELGKVFSRKLTWVCTALLCLLAFVMWSGEDMVITPGGERLGGRAEVEYNQRVARKYAGELTPEKVYEIMTTEGPGDSGIDSEMTEYYRQPLMNAMHYLFADVEDELFGVGEWGQASSEQIVSQKEAYIQGVEHASQKMEADGLEIRLGYSESWERILYLTTQGMMFAGAIAAILLAGIFADEYTRGTDALILTSRYGRKRVAAVKVLAGILAAAVIYLLYLLCVFLRMFFSYGLEGWDTSIQVSSLGVYTDAALPINYLQAFLLEFALWMMGMLMVAATTMIVSVWSRSSFIAVVAAVTLYFFPAIIAAGIPAWLLCLTPIGMLSATVLLLDPVRIGTVALPSQCFSFLVGIVVIALAFWLCRRSFSKHQVS
ncbi:MAG: ABC transporter permease subunit [Blautia sp.]|jgi:hypothetical protein